MSKMIDPRYCKYFRKKDVCSNQNQELLAFEVICPAKPPICRRVPRIQQNSETDFNAESWPVNLCVIPQGQIAWISKH